MHRKLYFVKKFSLREQFAYGLFDTAVWWWLMYSYLSGNITISLSAMKTESRLSPESYLSKKLLS
jgi:hypothetical protein